MLQCHGARRLALWTGTFTQSEQEAECVRKAASFRTRRPLVVVVVVVGEGDERQLWTRGRKSFVGDSTRPVLPLVEASETQRKQKTRSGCSRARLLEVVFFLFVS